MPKEALLIVDVQNDFCPGGSLAVSDGNKVVTPLNSLVKYAREKGWEIVASRDWHPEKTTHFENWPPHCVQGTKGAEFHSELDLKGVTIFSKGTGNNEDSYTAFDGVNEKGQKLEDYLKNAQVLQLYVAGLATDYCVRASALDALAKGFDTSVLTDAIKPVNIKSDDGFKALQEMIGKGARLTTTNHVISPK